MKNRGPKPSVPVPLDVLALERAAQDGDGLALIDGLVGPEDAGLIDGLTRLLGLSLGDALGSVMLGAIVGSAIDGLEEVPEQAPIAPVRRMSRASRLSMAMTSASIPNMDGDRGPDSDEWPRAAGMSASSLAGAGDRLVSVRALLSAFSQGRWGRQTPIPAARVAMNSILDADSDSRPRQVAFVSCRSATPGRDPGPTGSSVPAIDLGGTWSMIERGGSGPTTRPSAGSDRSMRWLEYAVAATAAAVAAILAFLR